MPGSNAGIRRNRRPAGEKTTYLRTNLSPATAMEMKAAAKASGNLSPSLYLERLAAMLRAERGALPIFNDDEETPTAAA